MEICGMKRESDRKCVNHARVHASAQSFDRCEGPVHTTRKEFKNLTITGHFELVFEENAVRETT